MIGSIIGDIVGSVYEFNNIHKENFRLFTKKSTFTDDTICTIAIADAAMNGRRFDESLLDWCGRYPTPKGGYGARFIEWLNSTSHSPYYSLGNGSAMRVSSIGWLYDTWEQVASESRRSAAITHNHPEGILGAQATALGILFLRSVRDKERFEKWFRMFYNIPIYSPGSNTFDETCMNAVPVAASCFLASTGFEDAIRKAVAVGGDSDTIAAICGGFAEAYYGVPDRLRENAINRLPNTMKDVIKQFEIRIKS